MDVTVTPQPQPGAFSLIRPPQAGSVVILTSQRPPTRQALDWLTRCTFAIFYIARERGGLCKGQDFC